METLTADLKVKIVELLNLQHINPAEIEDDELLFGGKMELDSIDALELIVLLERDYGVKIASKEEGLKIFKSVKTIAEHIKKSQAA